MAMKERRIKRLKKRAKKATGKRKTRKDQFCARMGGKLERYLALVVKVNKRFRPSLT